MPLNLNGTSTQETLERLETDGKNELTIEGAATGDDVGARVEVSHTTGRWSLAAFLEYWRGRGTSVGGKATLKLGD